MIFRGFFYFNLSFESDIAELLRYLNWALYKAL